MGTVDGGAGGGEEVERGNGEKIFVSVRLRPLSQKEIAGNDVSDWECINDNTIIFRNGNLQVPDRSMYPTAYTFDRVFRSDSPTRQVYDEAAKEVALSVVSGINSSVFAYGQTSSGKTFTMTGIIEYALSDIYAYIEKHTERQFHLKFSAMEIYNESVRDLLSSDSSALRLLDDPERGTVVEKLTEETLSDWNHVMELLSVCEAQRQIGETSLNETSSRSHQIIRLTIESSAHEFLGKDNSTTLLSAVNFVDLAGSERASQSLAAGTRLKEGCHINRSLLTLGTVIRKLSKGRNGHIPFRDSKLTRILQSSLGGNARTAIICTMSPARSHVEQSRNTLLFASCAKEVSTNAHVNVVMSDKALVKHLQRELARLENELRIPKSADFTPKYSALLQEKDLLIEKLEKDIKDLNLQLDNAQTQFQNFVQMVGEDRNSLGRVSSGEYPHLRTQKSESQNSICGTSILADPHSLQVGIRAFDTSQSFDKQSESSEGLYAQFPVLQGNSFHNDSSRWSIRAPSLTDGGSFQGREVNEELGDGASEVVCKEVRCIETEESSTEDCAEFNLMSSQEDSQLSAWIGIQERHAIYQESRSPLFKEGEFMSPSWKEGKDSVSLPCKEGKEYMSLSLMKGGDYVLLHCKEDRKLLSGEIKEDKGLKSSSLRKDRQFGTPKLNENRKLEFIHSSVVPFLEKPSPCHDAMENLSSSRDLKLSRSRSCRASFVSGMSCQWLDNAGDRDSTPPNGSEKDFTRRPEDAQRKLFALNHTADAGSLSRKASQSSLGTAINIETEAENEKTSKKGNVTDISKSVAGEKEMAHLQHEKQVDADSLIKKVQTNATQYLITVKDVGLDPIEDDSKGAMTWPSQFKKLQGEIIELWHACNVSLVHRSYFFLLFNGHDQTDSVYMEVELRRLSFLKDAFTQGIKTAEDGVNLTPASSLKTLCREREMLSRQMLKRLSEQDRDALYLKWGIGLNTRFRRLQLANHFWTKTQDLDHIADSAAVILKLVGFEEQVSSPKAMFRLDFAPRMRKSSTFRRSLIPFL